MSAASESSDVPLVIAGVHDSPGSRVALAWAAEEADRRDWQARAILAWTLPTPRGAGGGRPPVGLTDAGEQQAQAQALLERVAREVLGADHRVRCTAVAGPAAKTLVAAGRTARLLVIGARGRRGVAGMRLGLVSEQVAHEAPCPILIVPGDTPYPES